MCKTAWNFHEKVSLIRSNHPGIDKKNQGGNQRSRMVNLGLKISKIEPLCQSRLKQRSFWKYSSINHNGRGSFFFTLIKFQCQWLADSTEIKNLKQVFRRFDAAKKQKALWERFLVGAKESWNRASDSALKVLK